MSAEGTSIETLRAPMPMPASAAASSEVERSIAEVQAAMVIAKRFPRDEERAFAKVVKACKRPGLAEAALYAYTKGGSEVSGPSIRLAEELARDWGNISYGWKILSQDDESSEVRAEAWDLETNVPSHITFTVRHEFKAQGKLKKVTDPREVYELVANQASRRLRACILRIIPGDVQDAAVEQCEKTMKDGSGKPLSDRVRDMMAAFLNEHGVTREMVERRVGKKIEAINETEFLALARIFVSLRDGMAKVEQFFEVQTAGAPAGQPTAKELQRAAPAPAGGGNPTAAAPAGGGRGTVESGLQHAARFTPGQQSMFTVVDALTLVNRGEFEQARDLARSFSEDDKKKVEASIAARGGAPAAAQPQQAAEPEPELPLPPQRKGDIELADVLKAIGDATADADLQAAGTLIDDLPPEDQDVARRHWMKRKSSMAAPQGKRGRRGANIE